MITPHKYFRGHQLWVYGTLALGVMAGAARGDSGSLPTTGEKVNAAIDNLAATGNRLLELPLFMVLMVVAVVGLGLVLWGWTLRVKRGTLGRAMMGAGVLAVVLGAVFVVDQKIVRLQRDVSDLRSKTSADEMTLMDEISKAKSAAVAAAPVAALPTPQVAIAPAVVAPKVVAPKVVAPKVVAPKVVVPAVVAPKAVAPAVVAPKAVTPAPVAKAKPPGLLFDMEGAKKSLAGVFANVTVRALRSEAPVNLVQIHSSNPLVQVYVAVVDLANPAVSVKIGAGLNAKTLTSDFAKKTGCTLAINGEAGESPRQGSGFGVWHGNLVVDGKVMMKETANDPRPFLSFDANNKATFTAMSAQERAVPADGKNVIWGRLDAVVNGVVQTENERLRQPRTAMGISQDGTKLILLVADGRQQNYSVGLMRSEVGQVLKAFGASNGMLCDEGGSSCMYMVPFGIGNSPSDGEERITYTHFGVMVKQ